jgi:hypothetical protein
MNLKLKHITRRLFSTTQKAQAGQGGFLNKDGVFDMEAF